MIYQTITKDAARIEETLQARQTIILKEIVMDVACSGACIFRTPGYISRTDRDSTMPRDGNTAVAASRSTSPVQICHSTTDYPIQNRNQDIINPIGPFSIQWINNTEKLKTSTDGFLQKIEVLNPY